MDLPGTQVHLQRSLISECSHLYTYTHTNTRRLYATFMMVGCVKEELQGMKEGLTDIIPAELLAGLTAEVS